MAEILHRMEDVDNKIIPVGCVLPGTKTDEEIAAEGLDRMEAWMREIGLVMNVTRLGVTEDMMDGIADGSFIMKGGYKVLSHEDIVEILKESAKA